MLQDLIHLRDLPLLLLACLVFLSFFFLIRAILMFLANPERQTQRRLKQRLKGLDGIDPATATQTLLKKSSLQQSLFDQILDRIRLADQLELILRQANLSWKTGTVFLLFGLSGMGGGLIGLSRWGLWGGLAGGVLGLFIPYKILVIKGKRRLQQFERQLPDALDLLARGLRAGHAFPAGLQQVAKEMPDPLGTEFSKVYTEISHGMDFNTALLGLCDRNDLQDLSFFTTAVLIQRETGGNLTEILEKISHLIRERFKLRNQIKALTAEGRLSGIILILLPPVLAMILMIINPEYESQLFSHPLGQLMCVAAVFFQLLGMVCIHKIVNIKV
jgi:tight adherence protein B